MRTHDEFFGDALGGEYRVTVEHRAKGIPLLGDHMARITGVPVGAGQNLFALHPLVHPKPFNGDQANGDQANGDQSGSDPADRGPEYFPIQRQLLDVQQGFFEARLFAVGPPSSEHLLPTGDTANHDNRLRRFGVLGNPESGTAAPWVRSP